MEATNLLLLSPVCKDLGDRGSSSGIDGASFEGRTDVDGSVSDLRGGAEEGLLGLRVEATAAARTAAR